MLIKDIISSKFFSKDTQKISRETKKKIPNFDPFI